MAGPDRAPTAAVTAVLDAEDAATAETLPAAAEVDGARPRSALPPPAVGDPLQAELEGEPFGFDFYHALRRLACLHPDGSGLGHSRRASDDPVRLAQEPALDFAPAALTGYERAAPDGRRPARLAVRFLGLFGPNGALPLHLTEYARARLRAGDPAFARFADVFHHRMLSLFYRAWADAQPAAQHDRGRRDRFAFYVAALCGYGASPALRDRDALPDRIKLHFAGHLVGHARHPDALVAMLRAYFRLPVRLREFVGDWVDIPPRARTRLGVGPRHARLGTDAVIGVASWQRQHRFRLIFGPLDLAAFERLLPAGGGPEGLLPRVAALVRTAFGDELAWDLQLVLRQDEVPAARLDGRGQLGWTTWLGTERRTRDADDLVLAAGVPTAAAPAGATA